MKSQPFGTVTRYAVTHQEPGQWRTLCFANWGRNHYDTRAEAEAALVLYAPSLTSKLDFHDLEVRAVLCYEHGDAIGVYFPDADCSAEIALIATESNT